MKRKMRPYAVAGLLGGAAALALAFLWLALVPQWLAAAAARTLEKETGLGMAVTGSASIAFADGPYIRFTKVRIASARAPGGLAAEIAEVRLPLTFANFFGRIPDMPVVAASGAVINLDVAVPLQHEPPGGADISSSEPAAASPPSRIRFEDSALRLFDSQSGFSFNLSDASGLAESGAARNLLIHVSGLINGAYSTLRVESEDAARLFGKGAPTDILLSSDKGELRFSGRAAWKSGAALDGRLFAASRKTADLLAWLGLPAALAPRTGIELESAFSAERSSARLPGLSLKLGASGGTGDLSISYQGGGLAFDGILNADNIEMSQLWPDSAPRSDWSSAPFPWLPLANAKGKLQVNAPSLAYDRWTLQDARTTLEINSEAASVSLGTADGKVAFSASATRASPPAVNLGAKLDAASAKQVLMAMAGFPWLTGTAGLQFEAAAVGDNPASLVSSLAGKISIALSAGAVDGYAIGDLLVESGKGWRSAPGDATPGLSASIAGVISEGIVTLGKAEVKADGMALKATGEVDLLRQALDIEVATDGSSGLPGKTTLTGSWYDPDFGAATAQSGGQPQAPSAN